MTLLREWLTGSLAESLCLALLHSLWLGVAWSALLLLLLRRIPDNRPRLRYAVAVGCLYGLLGGTCLSWSVLRYTADSVETSAAVAATATATREVEAPDGQTASALPVVESHGMPTQILTTPDAPIRSLALTDCVPWLIAVWIVGAGICLLISSKRVAAVRRLRSGEPIDDPEVLRLLDRLISAFGLSRPIELLQVDGSAVLGVVGVLKPVILVPASLAAGLTLDQWEAILAHELAHIRRGDYLVNLSQLVIESLLFFNPTVWWLSRQVRIEREACCDEAAVALTEQPIRYATLLVDMAERLQSDTSRRIPAVAFGEERSGTLMQRVRRIVTPGVPSRLTLKWPVAASFLVLALLAVGLLQTGTDLAVGVAARMLDDQQRVEVLAESAKEVGTSEALIGSEAEQELTVSGTIEVEGGEIPKEQVWISSKTERGNHTSFTTKDHLSLGESPKFRVTLTPGVSWLFFSHREYAQTVAGPFASNDGTAVENVRIVLTRGIDVPVTIVDETGAPVSDAAVRASPVIGGSNWERPATDAEGRVVLEHINPDLEYHLGVTALGHQEHRGLARSFEPNSPIRLEILRAKPTSGRITTPQGDAVAGATVKEMCKRRKGMSNSMGTRGKLSAVSDAEGHFQLTELEDTWTYDLLIESPDYAPTVVPNVTAGDTDIQVKLLPAIRVAGTIHGPQEHLERLQAKRRIQWRMQLRDPPNNDRRRPEAILSGQLEFEISDGIGIFALPPMAPGELTLVIGESFVRRDVTASVEDLRVDLSGEGQLVSADMPKKRPVRITFTRDGKKVFPQGALQMTVRGVDSDGYQQKLYQIENGVVEAEVYSLAPHPFDCHAMIGFWFDGHDVTTKIDATDGTREITIPVMQAGAVKGRILNADGTPASDAGASVKYQVRQKTLFGGRSFGGGHNANTNTKGEFFVSPIPFGAECSIRATRGKHIAIGEEFSMSAKNALPSFTFKLGPSVDATVRLLDPSGTPLRGLPAALACRHPLAPHSWGPPEFTDVRGEYRFAGLNPDLKGHYVAELKLKKDYVPTRVPLTLDGNTTIVRLQRGNVIVGTLLDGQGQPVSGADLHATPVGGSRSDNLPYEAEAPTDSEGRFRFSNLPRKKMRITAYGSVTANMQVMPTTADKAKPVTMRAAR